MEDSVKTIDEAEENIENTDSE